jgi:hypothetical protein
VQARLRSWVESVGQRLLALRKRFSGTGEESSTQDRPPGRHNGAIRVAGQRRLEKPQSSTDRTDTPGESSVGQYLPATVGADAKRDGNRLYNPDRPDVYITSDTWEDIEP